MRPATHWLWRVPLCRSVVSSQAKHCTNQALLRPAADLSLMDASLAWAILSRFFHFARSFLQMDRSLSSSRPTPPSILHFQSRSSDEFFNRSLPSSGSMSFAPLRSPSFRGASRISTACQSASQPPFSIVWTISQSTTQYAPMRVFSLSM